VQSYPPTMLKLKLPPINENATSANNRNVTPLNLTKVYRQIGWGEIDLFTLNKYAKAELFCGTNRCPDICKIREIRAATKIFFRYFKLITKYGRDNDIRDAVKYEMNQLRFAWWAEIRAHASAEKDHQITSDVCTNI